MVIKAIAIVLKKRLEIFVLVLKLQSVVYVCSSIRLYSL